MPEYTDGPLAVAPEGKNYTIQYGILAIIDKDGKVVQIRIHPGHILTWDATAEEIKVETGLDPAELQVGIYDDIPEDGMIVVFQNTGLPGNSIRAWGAQQLTGYPDVGGTGYAGAVTEENVRGGVEGMTVNPFAEGFIIEIIEK